MTGSSPTRPKTAEHLKIHIGNYSFSSDSLAKRGAFGGFKTALLARGMATLISTSSANSHGTTPLLARQCLLMFANYPVTKIAILSGCLIGSLADAYETYTGSSTISDRVAAATWIKISIKLF